MDYQALGVGLAALVTAVGTVVAGIYTARSGVAKDTTSAQLMLEQAENETNLAIANATKGRIEAIVQDATEARRRLREVEDESDQRYMSIEKTLFEQRRHGQRGWDLAAHHFGMLIVVTHILNNIFTVVDLAPDKRPDYEGLLSMIKNAMLRMATISIPKTLDTPLGPMDTGV